MQTCSVPRLFTDEEYISKLERDNAALRERVEDAENNITEMCNKLWGILYPESPTGWEYRTQPIAHIKERIAELEAEIAELKQDRTTGAGYQTFTVAR